MANLKEFQLFHSPKDRLRLTIGTDRSYATVKPAWASPLTYPEKYLCLLDAKGDEIEMIANPNDLDRSSLEAVQMELSRRYLTALVERVEDARSEFGVTYWHVQTDRGRRDFVTQSLQENAQWLSPTHLLIMDVDGNRFELKNIEQMDVKSRAFLATIL